MDVADRQAKEQAERARRAVALHGVALYLSKSVFLFGDQEPATIEVADQSWDLNTTIKHPSGRGLYLRVDPHDREARIAISGVYPSYEHRFILPSHRPSITVGLYRPVKAIATEIQRRFLVAYLKAYQEAVNTINGKSSRKSKIVEVGTYLAALVKDTRFNPDKLDSDSSVNVTGWTEGKHYFEVYTGTGDSFDLKAHNLTPDQLEAIVKILNPQVPEWR